MMRPTRNSIGIILPVFFLVLVAMTTNVVAQQDTPPPEDPKDPSVKPTDVLPGPPGDGRRGGGRRSGEGGENGGPPRLYERGGSQRMLMARRWRNPSPEDIELFIKVAGDLNPEWRNSLVELREDDPEGLKQAIARNGRRLWQLVELRDRNPKLYQLRLEEMQTQDKLRELGRAYRASVEVGPSAESERLLEELKQLALVQVDLQLRVRGEELAAMDEALKRLRTELLTQLDERDERAQALVERMIQPRPEGESGNRPEDRSRQRPGGGPIRGGNGQGTLAAPPDDKAS